MTSHLFVAFGACDMRSILPKHPLDAGCRVIAVDTFGWERTSPVGVANMGAVLSETSDLFEGVKREKTEEGHWQVVINSGHFNVSDPNLGSAGIILWNGTV
jgi:hypothetical protein